MKYTYIFPCKRHSILLHVYYLFTSSECYGCRHVYASVILLIRFIKFSSIVWLSKESCLYILESSSQTTRHQCLNGLQKILIPTLITNRLFCKLWNSSCGLWKINTKLLLHTKPSHVCFIFMCIRFEILNYKIDEKYAMHLRMSSTT